MGRHHFTMNKLTAIFLCALSVGLLAFAIGAPPKNVDTVVPEALMQDDGDDDAVDHPDCHQACATDACKQHQCMGCFQHCWDQHDHDDTSFVQVMNKAKNKAKQDDNDDHPEGECDHCFGSDACAGCGTKECHDNCHDVESLVQHKEPSVDHEDHQDHLQAGWGRRRRNGM